MEQLRSHAGPTRQACIACCFIKSKMEKQNSDTRSGINLHVPKANTTKHILSYLKGCASHLASHACVMQIEHFPKGIVCLTRLHLGNAIYEMESIAPSPTSHSHKHTGLVYLNCVTQKSICKRCQQKRETSLSIMVNMNMPAQDTCVPSTSPCAPSMGLINPQVVRRTGAQPHHRNFVCPCLILAGTAKLS